MMERHPTPELEHETVSECLRWAYRIAQDSHAKEIERWVRLELGGYFASNSAMGEEIVVPEYRTVVGQHVDLLGRVFVVPPNFHFINETRLRNGVEELEALASSRDTVTIHDPDMCDLIRQHLKVEVYFFRFSPIHLIGVLSAIRTELQAKLKEFKPPNSTKARSEGRTEDILQLQPNLYGIGVDLRALWRRWKGSRRD